MRFLKKNPFQCEINVEKESIEYRDQINFLEKVKYQGIKKEENIASA